MNSRTSKIRGANQVGIAVEITIDFALPNFNFRGWFLSPPFRSRITGSFLIIEDYIFEDSVSASRRSGYACPEPVEAARRGGQSPPYGKSLNSHELCKAQ